MKTLLFLLACLLVVVHSLDKQRDCKCRIQTQKRIVGGRLADSASFPWQISIMMQDSVPDNLRKLLPDSVKMSKHMCGGTIINEHWILTAAHCIPRWFEGDIKKHVIGYGDNDLVRIYDLKKYAKIQAAYRHPEYGFVESGINDIALIKLAEPLEFGETVQPACLGTEFHEHYEGALKTTGWGLVKMLTYDKETNQFKEVVRTRYLKEADVYDQTSTIGICQAIKEQQNICTNGGKYKGGRESACKGDSGGPLHYTVGGKTSVIGAVSFAEVNDLGKTMTLCTGETAYTRVSKYIDWIKAKVGDIC